MTGQLQSPEGPCTFLERIELCNFWCFAHLAVPMHPELTVLIARNGSGKTTVMDAIAIALGAYVGCFLAGTRIGANHRDVRVRLPYRHIEMMNNSGWQRARGAAGLGDLHVHDLRHTVGMRLREACVPECTVADILWHSSLTVTRHYSVAQIVEFQAALEKIKEDTVRWNRSLATLRREQGEAARGAAFAVLGDSSPPKIPQQRKTGQLLRS